MDDTPVEWDKVYSHTDTLFVDDFVGIADYNYHPDVAYKNTRQINCTCKYHRERHGTRVRQSWVVDGVIDPRDRYGEALFAPLTFRAIYRQKWEFMADQVAVLRVPQ